MITAQVLQDLSSLKPNSDLNFVGGSLSNVASQVLPPESCNDSSLVFVSKAAQLEMALKAKAAIIIAHKSLTKPEGYEGAFFLAPSIPSAMAFVLPLFDGKMNRFNQVQKIHPTAAVHETAHLGKNVSLGPFVVIGAGTTIADNCTIGANTVIENDVRIGEHTLIHPLVFVGSQTLIGAHCEIHPHTTIGADGFSFTPAADRSHRKIPQIGRVVIEDSVEIGANCAVDRAALTETRIGEGTKLDNFCHVAHNCVIGKHNVIAARFSIAGSSSLGSHCMIGGETALSDHVHVTDNVILGGRSGVTGDITKPGAYGGYPLEPLRDAMRTIANIAYITRLRKQMSKVVKQLGITEENN